MKKKRTKLIKTNNYNLFNKSTFTLSEYTV